MKSTRPVIAIVDWVLPVAFPMVMALGGMMGLMGLGLPGVEVGIATSAMALGTVVLLEAWPRCGWQWYA